MLLQEINHQDDTVEEIGVLLKTFPKTGLRMVQKLVNRPHRLKFRGFDLYDETGYGPAIDGIIHAIKEDVKKGQLQLQVHVALGKGHDEMMNANEELNVVRVFYHPEEDKIYLGVDAWVDGEVFGQHFDEIFEREKGEEFNYEDDEHRELFDAACREFNNVGVFGLLISADFDGMKPMWDLEREAEKGYYKGIEPYIGHMELIPL